MKWFTLAGALLLAGPALAQDALPAEEKLVIEDGAFVIEGKVQKPEVQYVVERSKLDKGFDLGLDEDFLQKIVSAASEPPF